MAIDGSELDLTNCGRFPRDNEADGPGLISKSDSGLEAYDRRDVFMGNRKSSESDSAGCGSANGRQAVMRKEEHNRDTHSNGRGQCGYRRSRTHDTTHERERNNLGVNVGTI